MKDSQLDDYKQGKMYERGLGGFPQDFPKAMECFRRAADEQNHPGAQFTLGMLLLLKVMVTKDDENFDYESFKEGKKWLYRAEDQGFPEAVKLKPRYTLKRDPSRLKSMIGEYFTMSKLDWDAWKKFFEQMQRTSP